MKRPEYWFHYSWEDKNNEFHKRSIQLSNLSTCLSFANDYADGLRISMKSFVEGTITRNGYPLLGITVKPSGGHQWYAWEDDNLQ